nr:hypothetical protein [Tanacetum cinerariifolium]
MGMAATSFETKFWPNTVEFESREFCLVTSFLFGDCSLDHLKGVNSCFRDCVFLEKYSVKGLDLNKLLNNHTEFNKLLDDDADFGSLTENPHNRVALMKKITDMEVEFQRQCMSVDKNPSCGSNVKAGNKESMCVNSSVKTSCANDINANNVHNDSMDFDHDLKVVEQNKFDQNVADKNLIHDFDQIVE